jgi:hypothetical protein
MLYAMPGKQMELATTPLTARQDHDPLTIVDVDRVDIRTRLDAEA